MPDLQVSEWNRRAMSLPRTVRPGGGCIVNVSNTQLRELDAARMEGEALDDTLFRVAGPKVPCQ